MKCPLRKESKSFWLFKWRDEFRDCLKEECAWWDSECEECVFLSIGKILSNLADLVAEMEIKMPHAEQFTK